MAQANDTSQPSPARRTLITAPKPLHRPSPTRDPAAFNEPVSPPAAAETPDRRAWDEPVRPARRSDRLMVWLVLMGLMVLALPPLLIDLRRGAVIDSRESMWVERSVETWRRHSEMSGGWSAQWLVPIRHGRSVFQGPPGVVWLQTATLSTLDPAASSERQRVYRARLVSVGAALVAVAGVFWAGYAIGGLAPAIFSALVLVACPVFIHFGRLATPDMPATAMGVLSAAAALWAMRPHRRPPARGRQVIGFGVCGLALGGATLLGGALAVAPAFLPVLLIGMLAPRRALNTAGLFAAASLAFLIVMPWSLMVHHHQPDAWADWLQQAMPKAWTDARGYLTLSVRRVLLVLLAVLPWTLWLLCAIAQPFSTSSVGWRSRMFIGWAWFFTVFAMLIAAPGEGGLHELLLILPAAAVLIGQLFRRLVDLSAEGRHARVWRVARWPTIVFFLVLSILCPLVLAFEPALVDRQWVAGPYAYPLHWAYHLLAGVLLFALAVAAARLALRHYPGHALLCWALWNVVLISAVAMPLSRGPLMVPTPTDTPLPARILPLPD